jgi:adenylosuccinate lyase
MRPGRACAAGCCALAEQHLPTPVLARTLMQPAQVTSFGFKAGWLARWCAPAHAAAHGRGAPCSCSWAARSARWR